MIGKSNKVDEQHRKIRRNKTFEGCWTCRLRKVKCDLQKPKCNKCKISKVGCGGYDINLVWMKPLNFDSESRLLPENQLERSDINKNISALQKRRNIPLVKYKKGDTYIYHEDMDDDLIYLQNPPKDKFKDGNVLILNKFGVMETNTNSTDNNIGNEVNNVIRQEPADILNELPMSPYKNPNIHGDVSNYFDNTNEWISNELRADFLLSASAVQGLPISSTSIDQSRSEIEFQNLYKLIFHKQPNDTDFNNASLLSSQKTVMNENDKDNYFNILFENEESTIESVHLANNKNQQTVLLNTEDVLHDNTTKSILNIDSTIVPLQDYFGFNGTNDSLDMPKVIMEIEESRLPPVISTSDPLLNFPTTALKINSLTRFLLNYYVQNVADLMTVLPIKANPWKKLYFPTALKTLGDLTGLGRTTNSRNSLFNALLAVSCFNLQSKFPKNSEEMLFYLNLGINFRTQAVSFLKICINNNVKNEKYKDILTAILSMNSIDVVWGTMSDCQYYLSICEDFIEARLKSRPKISKKAKLLHSIFAFLKVFQDSTALDKTKDGEIVLKENLLLNDSSKIRSEKFFDINSNYNVKYLDGRFHYSSLHEKKNPKKFIPVEPLFKNLVTESYSVTTETLNLNEMNTGTLYGLPNSLILLFSDCVSLLRHLEYYKINSMEIPDTFFSFCISFESRLLDWTSEWDFNHVAVSRGKSSNKQNSEDNDLLIGNSLLHDSLIAVQCHMKSFYNGLIIYYFTMVRGFDHSYFKNYVTDVIKDLNKISDLVDKKNVKMVPLIWQGFIAGCSCIDQSLQDEFRTWAAKLANTGVGSYWGARQVMLEVWRRQKNGEDNKSWYDVYKDWEMNLMLV